MKRLLFTIALMIYGIVNLHSQTILVLDFDTEIEDFQNNTKIMADMLRSDLVNTQKLDVIDRKSMDLQIEIMQNQMSDYMSNQNETSPSIPRFFSSPLPQDPYYFPKQSNSPHCLFFFFLFTFSI